MVRHISEDKSVCKKREKTTSENSALKPQNQVKRSGSYLVINKNRKISVQIMPRRMNLIFPSIISSGPSLTSRDVINSRALSTFSTFCTLIRGFLLYRPREASPARRLERVAWVRESGPGESRYHDFLRMLTSQ